jgi:hypothetical protein
MENQCVGIVETPVILAETADGDLAKRVPITATGEKIVL